MPSAPTPANTRLDSARNGPSAEDLGVTPEQGLALSGLLAGLGVTGAAQHAGVGRRTLTRWLREDAQFIAAYRQLQGELHDALRANLRGLAAESLVVVRRVIRSRKSPASLKLRGALAILRMVAAEPDPGPDDLEGVQLEMASLRRRRGLGRLDAASRRALEDLARDAFDPPPSRPDGPTDPEET